MVYSRLAAGLCAALFSAAAPAQPTVIDTAPPSRTEGPPPAVSDPDAGSPGTRPRITIRERLPERRDYAAEIAGLDLRTPRGDWVIHDFDFLPSANIVVGVAHPFDEIRINEARQRSEGRIVLLSVEGPRQERIARQADRYLGVYELDGTPRCFIADDIKDAGLRQFITLMIDRSGSMGGGLLEVEAAGRQFLQALPEYARCSVFSFNDEITAHTDGFIPCPRAAAALPDLQGGGGTDLYGAFTAAYQQLEAVYFDQAAVVAITDGFPYTPGADLAADRQLAQRQKNAVTFVYWMGDERGTQHVQGLADHFFASQRDVDRTLNAFLSRIVSDYGEQHLIYLPDDCP